MQMPVKAKTVFMRGFMALAASAVKASPDRADGASVVKILLNMSADDKDRHAGGFPLRHYLVPIDHHLRCSTQPNTKARPMPRTAPKPERKPAGPELVSHYRAIGPAAILAALICAQKKKRAIATSVPKTA